MSGCNSQQFWPHFLHPTTHHTLPLATYVWPAVATPQRTLLLACFFGSTLLHGLRSAPDGGIFGGPACLELVMGVERVTAAAPLGLHPCCTPSLPQAPDAPRPAHAFSHRVQS
jgi:hypothetical protein